MYHCLYGTLDAYINQPPLLHFYSGYEGVGKAISVCKQVLAI